MPSTRTRLPTWYEVRFNFGGGGGRGGVPGTVPLHTLGSTSQQESCNTNVPSGLVTSTCFCCWGILRLVLRHRGGEKGCTWYGASSWEKLVVDSACADCAGLPVPGDFTHRTLQKKSVNISPTRPCEFGCGFCCEFCHGFFMII